MENQNSIFRQLLRGCLKIEFMEETLAWQMEMPNGLMADCRTSYSESSNFLKMEAEKGWFELQPAFNYSGLKGNKSNGAMNFPKLSQQSKQMDAFALSFKKKQQSIVRVEMGRTDVRIIEAIYEAMKTSKRVIV